MPAFPLLINATSEPVLRGMANVNDMEVYNSLSLSPVILVTLAFGVILLLLLGLARYTFALKLGRAMRFTVTSVRYFLIGGATLAGGYGLYLTSEALFLYGAGGDIYLLLTYVGYAVGGYLGIAGLGYGVSRLVKRVDWSAVKEGFGSLKISERAEPSEEVVER